MKLPKSTFSSGELSLVLGVDGSGKTSFMNKVAEFTGAEVLEPTANQKAKDFKHSFFNYPITSELVDAREQLFSELNHDFKVKIDEDLEHSDVLTSGSILVTRLSHFAMRAVISSPQLISTNEIVDEWLTMNNHIPEQIVYLHAPIETIRARLLVREVAGDMSERLFGYNSLFFLDRYNKVLGSVISYLFEINPDSVSIYDTSLKSTAEIVGDFLST